MKGNYVKEEAIKELLDKSEVDVKTVFDKTTIVTVKLPNGFTLTEASGCVDSTNYDEVIGAEICMAKIEDKLWMLEGYLLQQKTYEEKNND